MPSMKETFRKRVGNYYLGRTLGEVRMPAPDAPPSMHAPQPCCGMLRSVMGMRSMSLITMHAVSNGGIHPCSM